MYASNIPVSGAPANVIYGTKDESLLAQVLRPVVDSVHTPWIMGFAPKGKGNVAHLLQGPTLFTMHGKEVITNGTKYSTFMTPFVELFNRKVNRILFQRLIPDDATIASLRLYAEVFTQEIDTPVKEGEPPVGKQIVLNVIYRVGEFSKDQEFGKAERMEGTNTNHDGTSSIVLPLYDISAPYEGDYCRNFRFSFSCPNAKSSNPVSASQVERIGSRVFRMQIREASEVNINGNIVNNLDGGSAVLYSHVHGAKDPSANRVYDYRYVIANGYIDKRPREGIPAMPGPFEGFHVYEDHMNELLTTIGKVEEIEANMVDPFTAMDMDGTKYTKVKIDNGTLGGEILNESHFHPFIGGADGTMNNVEYDKLCRREYERFGKGPVKLMDMLRYPFSHVWDGGFSLKTKEAMANCMTRPNVTVVECPFAFDMPSNDVETESSVTIAIAQYMRAFPESQRYTTGALRGYIVGQDFLLNDKSYLDRLPLTYHLAELMADYAGGTQLNADKRFFDGGEYTVIKSGYDVSLPTKENTVYENDYANGLIYAIAFDDHRFFFPSMRSIYDDHRSVLVGMLPSLVCGDLMMVSQRVWAETTGNQTMDEEEYAKLVSQKILNRTSSRYDTVKDISVNVYFTEEDRAAGNQCSVDIFVKFNTNKNVHKVSVIAQRAG
ncbi:MAG: hypothetical protein ACRDDY_14100 [Clostridium sp.]|uniref:hypothetical protein n=1 Tax=Clostridium sp. TaxID=1506 RepID=UPI003EE687C4